MKIQSQARGKNSYKAPDYLQVIRKEKEYLTMAVVPVATVTNIPKET